jgi:hypothetical protein
LNNDQQESNDSCLRGLHEKSTSKVFQQQQQQNPWKNKPKLNRTMTKHLLKQKK